MEKTMGFSIRVKMPENYRQVFAAYLRKLADRIDGYNSVIIRDDALKGKKTTAEKWVYLEEKFEVHKY